MLTPFEPGLRKILADITGIAESKLPAQIELNSIQKTDYDEKKSKLEESFPLDYLLSKVEIAGMYWRLTPAVLIPRPETEEWVMQVIQSGSLQPQATVLDLGCGSGFIGLSIAAHLRNKVILSDISTSALEIAEINARLNQFTDAKRIRFIRSDLLTNPELVRELGENWILLANLPYVPISDMKSSEQNNTRFEPDLALYSGSSGLDLFKRTIEQLGGLTFKPKMAVFELDPRNILEAQRISKHVFARTEIAIDSNRMARVLKCFI